MSVRFLFKARTFDPFAFNLTASVSIDDPDSRNMGLLIASRMVDQFSIRLQDDSSLSLNLIKNKTYPPWTDSAVAAPVALADFVITKPDNELVKQFAKKATQHFDESSFPGIFRSPARLTDMVNQGGYRLLVICGRETESNEVGGGIIWRSIGKAMIQFYGPYIFNQPKGADMARSLTDAFLAAIAKSDALGTYSYYTTGDLPAEYFESIGSVNYTGIDGSDEPQHFVYRQLKEDHGASMWADPSIEPFLRQAYSRLYLPRRIAATSFAGEHLGDHSVFSLQFNRARSSVTIRPVWDGKDYAGNIADHVKLLKKEGLTNLFFEIDLSVAWQARIAPALDDNAFLPVLLLPYAGRGDIVVFQHELRGAP
jgi:hypothetical protein